MQRSCNSLNPVKFLSIICLVPLILVIPNTRVRTKPGNTIVLQLKWHHQFQFAGYYTALEKGFFKEEGLHVKIVPGGPNVKVDEEVASGRAHYGVLASEILQKWQDGKPLVIIAPIIQHSVRSLIVRKNSKIYSPHDLTGKRVAVNINEDAEIKTMFLNEGISLDKVIFIPKDKNSQRDFLNGKIDALLGSIGNQPYIFEKAGVPVRTIRPINYGVDFYGDTLFTSTAESDNNPERVEAMLRAVIRGWRYAFKNQEEIIPTIQKKYASQKTSPQLQYEAMRLKSLTLPELVEVGHNNPKRWERIAMTYSKVGLMKPVDSLEKIFYNPGTILNYKWLVRLATALTAALAILSGVLFWNRLLRHRVNFRTRELYHRTKNNMSIITALLDIYPKSINDKAVLKFLEDTKMRIMTMSLVHDTLYEAQDLSRLNLKEYVDDLINLLLSHYNTAKNKISIKLNIENVYVLLDTAIPTGLILNELISNSLKYAFPGNAHGEINLSICRQKDNSIYLEVADNGQGLPPDFDLHDEKHQGIQNVFIIGEQQLKGNVEYMNNNGLSCGITFNDNLYKPRV